MSEWKSAPAGTDPEALLRRWRETGDAAALGELFDATAPELFGVALHLCRDPARAEDALQETYLAALESLDRFERGRRVVPWLVGILRNKLHEVRRFEGRAADPVRVGRAAPPPDPALEASSAEEEERVRRALADLPEPYREVAMLRWRHGLEPAEIAELKRMSPGTVRSLLHRALERLRRALVAMPSLLFGDAGGRSPRGLGAVRDAVLAHGAAAAAAAGSVIVVGGIIMAKKTVVAAAAAMLLLVGGVGVWSAVRPRGEDGAKSPEEPGTGSNPAPVASAVTPASPADAPADVAEAIPPPVDLAKCDRDLDLFGLVVDGKGVPVPGARLSLFEYPLRRGLILVDGLGHWKEAPGPSCLSSTDGSFAFRLRRGHLTHLRAKKTGLAEAVLSDCQAGERVKVVMELPGRLVLRARDETGKPVAGVRVRLSSSYKVYFTRLDRSGTTDATGVCHFENLVPGQVRLHDIEHDRLVVKDRPRVEVPPGGVVEAEIVLVEGRTVRGTVTDADTEEPIEGARVGAYWVLSRPVLTGKDGAFAYPGWLGEEMANLHVVAPGWGRAAQDVPADGPVHFRLHRGDEAVGVCVGSDGAPVAGAVVCAMGSAREMQRQEIDTVTTASGPDGRFRLTSLRRDLSHTLVVMAPGHGRTLLDFPPREGEAGTIDFGTIRLQRGQAIEGRVLGPDGEPLPEARVVLQGANADRLRLLPKGAKPSQDSYGTNETRRTDDLGRFRFPDLAPGSYRLEAAIEGQPAATTNVDLVAGKDSLGIELRAAAAGPNSKTLVVVTVDEAGAPVAGIKVTAEQGGARAERTTGPDGRAVLEGLKEEPASVTAWDIGAADRVRYLHTTLSAKVSSDETLRIVLRPRAEVSGTVVGPDGKPVGGVMVYATDDLEKRQPKWAVQVESDGRFRLQVPPGIPLVIHLPDSRSGDARSPYRGEIEGVVAPAEGVVLRASPLRTDLTLTIELQDEGGAPVGEGTVMAIAPPRFPQAVVDASGRATLQGLPGDQVEVMVQRPRSPTHRVWDEAVPPAHARVVPGGDVLVLRFRKGVALRGRVVDEQESGVAGANVGVQTQDYAANWVQTGDDGTFSVFVLPGERLRSLSAEKRTADGKVLRVQHADFDPGAGEVVLKVVPVKE